jgi:hypothetical protein
MLSNYANSMFINDINSFTPKQIATTKRQVFTDNRFVLAAHHYLNTLSLMGGTFVFYCKL